MTSRIAADAQQTGKVYRIGHVTSGSRGQDLVFLRALEDALKRLGYIEGQDLQLEYRFADGQVDRLDLVAVKWRRCASAPRIFALTAEHQVRRFKSRIGGGSTEYLPVPVGDGWWELVPIWKPDETPNPLRRWAPAVPYWAADT
jgi:hypothetical protein